MEANAWRSRTGAPQRDVPERFGNRPVTGFDKVPPEELAAVDADGRAIEHPSAEGTPEKPESSSQVTPRPR